MNRQQFLEKWVEENKASLGLSFAQFEHVKETCSTYLELSPVGLIDAKEFQEVLSKLILDFEKAFPQDLFTIIDQESLIKLNYPEPLFDLSQIEDPWDFEAYALPVVPANYFMKSNWEKSLYGWHPSNKFDSLLGSSDLYTQLYSGTMIIHHVLPVGFLPQGSLMNPVANLVEISSIDNWAFNIESPDHTETPRETDPEIVNLAA